MDKEVYTAVQCKKFLATLGVSEVGTGGHQTYPGARKQNIKY